MPPAKPDMTAVDLRPDCTRCAALCCVALALNDPRMFAIEKEAGTPCPNLDEQCACKIHEEREERGYRGCVAYDCLGAGQRVTQDFFQGRSWKSDPSLLRPMCDVFSVVTRAHKLLQLLREAGNLDLSDTDRQSLADLQRETESVGTSFETISAIEGRARRFLGSLRAYVRDSNSQAGPDLQASHAPAFAGKALP